MAETTAIPWQPASIVCCPFSAVMPPMATTGTSTARQICRSVSRVMVELALVEVGNTAHRAEMNVGFVKCCYGCKIEGTDVDISLQEQDTAVLSSTCIHDT